MFISDFIKELEKLKNEYGEIQVLVRDEYGNEDDFDCYPSKMYDVFRTHYENIVVLEK